jgi:pimeloyl-ACP methyl ester carboxylesterase/DNA-binding winged helix-turn-helix (wHTH) protein
VPQYLFDEFLLDSDRFELRRADEVVAVEPQVFEVLSYLVQHSGRLVSRDELIGAVWPEGFISDAALSARIMSARKAVCDSGHEQRFIRTVHGRGFRFIAPVTVAELAPRIPVRRAATAPAFEQEVRFCSAADGARIAYAVSGAGPPLVKAANWLTHLEFDPTSPVWRHLWRELSEHHRLVRYDGRGSGLSDWDLPAYSFDSWVDDLEAVVGALELKRFSLLGISQGGAVAIAYAARHPDRVSSLVLLGAYARGRLHRNERWIQRHQLMRDLIVQGWGREEDAFREIFSLTMIPDGSDEQRRWLTDLQRESATAENALLFHDTAGDINVEHLLPGISVPTLVLHARGDQRAPFDEGRRLATQIPQAAFVSLDSRNHLLLEDERAWARFRSEVRSFLASHS